MKTNFVSVSAALFAASFAITGCASSAGDEAPETSAATSTESQGQALTAPKASAEETPADAMTVEEFMRPGDHGGFGDHGDHGDHGGGWGGGHGGPDHGGGWGDHGGHGGPGWGGPHGGPGWGGPHGGPGWGGPHGGGWGPPPPPPPRWNGCDDGRPVCGRDGRSYNNYCEADRFGGGVWYWGWCR